ncbi:YhfC family intramembrane metalloprotease [Haloimpatiens sp. FM7315]|uniref:YhfC family intramembrane metalloprotease n=1 Tax=Haloimpatiens sp. FM7315 TaxID=3298609 RepID=UPI0035A2C1B5
MENSALIMFLTINIIICFSIPFGYIAYLIIGKKKMLKPFFIGALVFLVSQVFLRIPILKYILPKIDNYNIITAAYPIINCIILGLTAGIFEEIGRFLGFKFFLKKNRTWFSGLSFGIGHGGIEAIIIVGIPSLQNLIALVFLNAGNNYSEIFKVVTGFSILLGGVERIFTVIIHIALTLMILYGINQNKKAYLLLAIVVHGIIDSGGAIMMTAGFNVYFCEAWVAVCSVLLLIYSIKIRSNFKGDVINEKIF